MISKHKRNKPEDVSRLIAQGMSNAEIASKLNIKVTSVKRHVTNVLKTAGVASRAEYLAKSAANEHLMRALGEVHILQTEIAKLHKIVESNNKLYVENHQLKNLLSNFKINYLDYMVPTLLKGAG